MNDLIQMFKTRRSCKAYTDQKVEESVLDAILEAGTYAPTGMGRQSPLIVCVQDQETRDKISQLNAAIMKTDIDPFYGAPIVVVVFGDTRVPTYRDDANLVMGNLLNAAHAAGVDSCYIYRAREVFQTPEGQELMKQWGIDPAYEGIGNVILGYGKPEGIKPAAKRKADYIRKI
ncbi:nitroreductase [uncultured Faecalicoccus sp.]|uniref:nitroreductase n=1 Tax=uncultured Faecalicoccus sp. TaxID=1971760 RepID=UPI0025CFF142|nr:nitroreductase [uncultured Faecalicoccus sp.]